jgi:hypothetical protein
MPMFDVKIIEIIEEVTSLRMEAENFEDAWQKATELRVGGKLGYNRDISVTDVFYEVEDPSDVKSGGVGNWYRHFTGDSNDAT